ncbi:DUF2262 domain-containing protein [Novipirellula sp. SH528]|uniref:DUF2262 domain-containing protein n=1 Tax=Novipirellula sp. SH528 TaxID=3454466 RepID=UPI003F9F8160
MPKYKRNSSLPDVIDDPVLGTLAFTVALDGKDEYEATARLGGRRVEVTLYTDSGGQLRPCIVRARRIVENFPAIQTKMYAYVLRNIFPTYNETFRMGRKPITVEQLTRKLKLEGVTTHPEPRATFWFNADDAFLDHGLQLFMGERNRFVDHDMPG